MTRRVQVHPWRRGASLRPFCRPAQDLQERHAAHARATAARNRTRAGLIIRLCSRKLVSISPVAIGVSSAVASAAWSRHRRRRRLLDPREVEFFEPAARASPSRGPLLVASTINGLSPRCLRTAATRFKSNARSGHLDLDAADAARARRVDILQHLVQRRAGSCPRQQTCRVACEPISFASGSPRASPWVPGATSKARSPAPSCRCGPSRRPPTAAW